MLSPELKQIYVHLSCLILFHWRQNFSSKCIIKIYNAYRCHYPNMFMKLECPRLKARFSFIASTLTLIIFWLLTYKYRLFSAIYIVAWKMLLFCCSLLFFGAVISPGLYTNNVFFSCLSANKKIFCYYSSSAQYKSGIGKFLPDNIEPSLCTHVIFAFVDVVHGYKLEPSNWNDLGSTGKFLPMYPLSLLGCKKSVMFPYMWMTCCSVNIEV